MMKRVLIFGLPLVALVASLWAAWQVCLPVDRRAETLVVMLPGPLPDLQPYLRTGEAERQILDLLHAPMIRVDSQGALAPGLADSWTWRQQVTCWFADTKTLQDAQRMLADVPPPTRQAWGLEQVLREDLSLVMRFVRLGEEGSDIALPTLAEMKVLPLFFLSLDSDTADRQSIEDYAKTAGRAAGVVRVWFDETGRCELVTTGPLHQVRETLSAWQREKGRPIPQVKPMAEVAALSEPVLDFRLAVANATWQDGAPVTAADVRASVQHVLRLGYPVPGRESFRHIQDISPQGSTGVRVTYRKNEGSALVGWAGFPILPESWLKAHPEGSTELPPGAGEWRVVGRDKQGLTLASRATTTERASRFIRFVPPAPALQTRVALVAKALDVVWEDETRALANDKALEWGAVPPRNRLLVMWNVRSSRLSELAVRQALALGLDRASLQAEGFARAGEALFTPGLWYSPPASPQEFDAAAARQKLERAGWVRDVSGVAKKGGQALQFTLLVTTGNPQREHLAQELATQWTAIGAQVEIMPVESADLVAKHLGTGRYDAALVGLDYELGWDRTAFWHSGQIESGLNFSRLADPQMDLLLDGLAGEFETSQVTLRAAAVQERFQILQPALPLMGDLQRLGLRKERFATLLYQGLPPYLTLRSLVEGPAGGMPKMREPNE